MQLKNIGNLILCLLLCLSVGYIGNCFTQASLIDWYPALIKPPGFPPPSAFAPIGAFLYAMMGVSLWWMSHVHVPKHDYALFYLQLFFNMLWPFFFFGMQSIVLGLIDMLIIDVILTALIFALWKPARAAALLLLPFLGWVFFLTYLNFGILVLNPI